jgi:pilus assembly protein Flp/PilA
MKNLLKRLLSEDRGQDVIEYALLAAGISVAVVPVVPTIGTTLIGIYSGISGQLPAAP